MSHIGMACKDNLLIVGAGGHGRVVADMALRIGRWQQVSFLDDDDSIRSSMGLEIIGGLSEMGGFMDDYDIFVAVGNNATRERLQTHLMSLGASIPTIIHPNAVIGQNVTMGIGTAIMAGAVVNCCSRIGDGCIINTGATIDHDSTLDDYVHVSPGAHIAGTVRVGRGSWVGIGAVISNNVSIVSGGTVGAGAVVIRDVTEPGIYVGIPARKID